MAITAATVTIVALCQAVICIMSLVIAGTTMLARSPSQAVTGARRSDGIEDSATRVVRLAAATPWPYQLVAVGAGSQRGGDGI